MLQCYRNTETAVYCKYVKTVDVEPTDIHKVVEPREDTWSCAWCTKHDCPCKDLNYHCSDMDLVKGSYNDDYDWIETPYEVWKSNSM